MNTEMKKKICDMLKLYHEDLETLWMSSDYGHLMDYCYKRQEEIGLLIKEIETVA
jgi:hypothetical protein